MARPPAERGGWAVTLFFSARHHFSGLQLDASFEAPSRGVTALFGPSGSGKSTILAILAGLLRPDECRIGLDGFVLADSASGAWAPPERRRVGVVFQDSRLFPHMSVAANLRYGLRRRTSQHIAFESVVDLLDIAALLDRRPHTLSGGERQRVAIGRALLAQPHLLLMDEPLASLDLALKAEILPYLARLPAALGLPILYVTHAFDEVAQLADWLVLIKAGCVTAAGKLGEIAARADLFLAEREDAGAVLTCRLADHQPARGLSRLTCGAASLLVPGVTASVGASLRVRVPAREVILASARATVAGLQDVISLHNILAGTVRAIAADPVRRAANVEVDLGGAMVLARVTPDAVKRLQLAPGAPVLALIKSMSVEVLPALDRHAKV
jgi:molybdate transport system ATP-binding protein